MAIENFGRHTTRSAYDILCDERTRYIEASAEDDYVCFARRAVRCDQLVPDDALYARQNRDVGLDQRRVPAVGLQNALAAQGERWCQHVGQDRISLDTARDMTACRPLHELYEGSEAEAIVKDFEHDEQKLAQHHLEHGISLEYSLRR